MACSCSCSLQYSSGRIDYPNLSGCQLPDVDYQDNTYRKYRPLELLALRLYRCGGLLRDGSEFALGLFRSHRLLHQYPGLCRPDSRQIPEILRFDGISIPQPFCQSFMPFAIVFNKLFDMIPGFSKRYRCRGTEEEVWCAR